MTERWEYPDPDAGTGSEFQRSQFERVHRAYGAKNVEELFGDSPTTPTPWPRAARQKRRGDFDQGTVDAALREPVLSDVDPRNLHSTQPGLTRQGVDYYLGDEYQETGTTFADQDQAGNRYPVVYDREDGQSLLLGGHHRGAAALLRGEQLRAVRTEGPWGPPRGQR